MKKLISILLVIILIIYTIGCSSNGLIAPDNPPSGASVIINLIDGTTKEGVILKKEGNSIRYVDAQTHEFENLEITNINTIKYSDKVYDLSGNLISENDISDARGIGKTFAYGLGGFALGGIIGFGAGAVVESITEESFDLLIPILAGAAAGAIVLGINGAELDREDAIVDIQRDRYKETQRDLQKQIEDDQKEIQEQQKEKEKMQKELQKSKKPGE